MKNKVCILTAGKGTRNSLSKNINKSLLPVSDRAMISHIISRFPKDTRFIIALGYNKKQVKDYISIAHPELDVIYQEIDNWEGKGSGPGYSLLCCKDHLKSPFIFISCDTYIEEETIPQPEYNWIGSSYVKNPRPFCMIEKEKDKVTALIDKPDKKINTSSAFIGLAGIYDYKLFWSALENSKDRSIKGEFQVSFGLQALIKNGLHHKEFSWLDTGTDENYQKTINRHPNTVLPKLGETIYFEDDKVIKYFNDQEIIRKRLIRAKKLKGFVPEILDSNDNFYTYKKIPGKTLSEVYDPNIFKKMLYTNQKTIWKTIPEIDNKRFQEECISFYKEKTLKRIKQFHTKTGILSKKTTINGTSCPPIDTILNKIDWTSLSLGIPVNFHGDFQPENIIIDKNKNPIFIDWRQDYAGNLNYGDIYYEFAKLHHALIISGEVIRKKLFNISGSEDDIVLSFMIKNNLAEYKSIFEEFLIKNNYDLLKTKTLSYLIFLNIAPLHHSPYDKFLYYLGIYMLTKLVNDNG